MQCVRNVRRKQSLGKLRFFGWIAVALAVQTVAILVVWLVAKHVYGLVLHATFVAGISTIVTIVLAAMTKWVAPLAFKGKAPEEVAADAFFQAKDVRSDDNRFEDDLKP